MYKKTRINGKRGRGWPIFKKQLYYAFYSGPLKESLIKGSYFKVGKIICIRTSTKYKYLAEYVKIEAEVEHESLVTYSD